MNIFDLSRPEVSSRRAARVALAVLVVIGMIILLTPGGFSPSAVAQQATASPTSTTGYDINILNPSCYSTTPNPNPTGQPICQNEMSTKSDRAPTGGTNPANDTNYHLVAWLSSVPPSPAVEFKLYDAADTTQVHAIGTATPTPRINPNNESDTWEYHWQIPSTIADGSYTIRATLFTGGQPLSRDSQPVRINNTDPSAGSTDSDPQGETLEILHPRNGLGMGFYPPDPRSRTQKAIVDVSYSMTKPGGPPPPSSGGTRSIEVFYTVSAPGTEPKWTSCGEESADSTGGGGGDADDGITCTLAATDDATRVTGVAAVTNDDPRGAGDPAFNDSGDAHRVHGYDQEPKTVILTTQSNASRDNVAKGGCSPTFLARVEDQFGAKIFGADVDAHAMGPTDNLKFVDNADSSAETADDPKAPDQGGHGSESAASNCSTGTGSTQGIHEVPLDADRKHVEAAAGTDDGGDWSFRLRSPDSGDTQITVWADMDENDRFCATEPRASSSIGWDKPAPGIAQLAVEENACGTQPPASASPSAPASPSATASPSPSSTVSATPSRSPTQSVSPRPTNTAGQTTPPPPTEVRHARDAEITRFRHVDVPGKKRRGLVVRGVIRTPDGFEGCSNGVPVKIQVRAGGRWVTSKSDTTNRFGVFKVLLDDAKGRYRVTATRFQISDTDTNQEHICLRTRDVRRHRH